MVERAEEITQGDETRAEEAAVANAFDEERDDRTDRTDAGEDALESSPPS